MGEFRWSGSDRTYLDEPTTFTVDGVVAGLYGGCTRAGAHKNEDGAMVWRGDDWVFAVVLDAHGSSQSTNLVMDLVEEHKARLLDIFNGQTASDYRHFHSALVEILTSPSGQDRLSQVRGETAGLFVFQRGKYLSWVAIGDNTLYFLHPDLAQMGQYTLTVRNFYEWVGQSSSLALPVHCYSTGVRELRQGYQVVALATDGLLEFDSRPYEDPDAFSKALLASPGLETNLKRMLTEAHKAGARDSATVIAWSANCDEAGISPTA